MQPPVMLSTQEPHFLRALYILCQGYLAARRMPYRVPSCAAAQTETREWWSVPLLASANDDLSKIVAREWISNVPEVIESLVNRIAVQGRTSSQQGLGGNR